MAPPLTRTFADPRFRRLIWLLVGALGWVGLVALGVALLAKDPPQAGFDLALILDAGRRVAAGASPYVAGAVSVGTQVESLFYSYPPPIAQAASLIGGVSDGVVLLAAGIGAVAGFAIVVRSLAAGAPIRSPWDIVDVVLPALALAPFIYPFAIALLFGNVDAWFPFAYGAALLAVVGGSRPWRIVGGMALGLAALAKLYPGLLLGWLAVRGLLAWIREGRTGLPGEWTTLAIALVTDAAAVGLSVLVGGIGPWADYIGVLRAGVGADFVSTLNVGPASQLAQLVGDPTVATRVAPLVAVIAILLTAAVAWRLRSVAVSLAVAATLSLVLSPITWFHYPVALLPFAAWAWIVVRQGNGRGTVAGLLAGAAILAAAAIAAPVVVWLAVALVLVAVLRASSLAAATPVWPSSDLSGGFAQGS
ncbi:MAG TPA: glycosyltransferase 87 family protein [Candidatus Limnocylindrales bacterium]